MDLQKIIKPQCFLVGAQFSSKDEVLRKIAELATHCEILKDIDPEKIYRSLAERESLCSTGIGGGIAIPHCRLEEIDEFVVGLITIPDGVDFDAVDEKPAKLVVYIIGPESKAQQHIKLLSEISHALRTPGAVEKLLESSSPEILYENLMSYISGKALLEEKLLKRSLVQIIVQGNQDFEKIFDEIITLAPETTVVIHGESASKYLMRMPIFAGFFKDSESEYVKIILALVSRKLVNEVIRRVESVVGKLNRAHGVILSVIHLSYSAGQLET